MPIESISQASNSCSEIQARMRHASGTARVEVPRMNAIFGGDGSSLIVTLNYKDPVELAGKPIKTKLFLLGKGIAFTIETVKGAAAGRSPKNGSSRSHEDEANV